MNWQLNLFKRGKSRLPPPKEFRMHVAFADAVRIGINKGWSWSHIPSGEYRTPETAGRLKRMGVQRGLPDFIFTGEGRIAFIELKRPGEQLSEPQTVWGLRLSAAGAWFLATDNIGDALAFLRDLGAVNVTVSA